MPYLGTIVRAQMANGHLPRFGTPWENPPGISPEEEYHGVIVGIWQVQANDHEPAHMDVLAVPKEVFAAFTSIVRGANPQEVLAKLESDARAAYASKKSVPSAMRRVFLMDLGPVLHYDASLSMTQAFMHFVDRNEAAADAYVDDDDADDDADETPDAQAATPAAPVAPMATQIPAVAAAYPPAPPPAGI